VVVVALIAFLALLATWCSRPVVVKQEMMSTPESTPRTTDKLAYEYLRLNNGQRYVYKNRLNLTKYYVRVDTYADGTAKAELELAEQGPQSNTK